MTNFPSVLYIMCVRHCVGVLSQQPTSRMPPGHQGEMKPEYKSIF